MKRPIFKIVGILVFDIFAMLSQPTERKQASAVQIPEQQTQASFTSDPSFLRVYKTSSSGKTGKSTRSVEIMPDGTILLRDASGQLLQQRQLGAVQQAGLAELIRGSDLASLEITDCSPLKSSDSDFFQIGIEEKYKTVIFRIFPNCNLPQRLKRLDSLLTDISPRK